MLAVTVRITGTQDVINKLKRLDSGLLNFEQPFKMIGEELVHYYSYGGQVFGSQGGVLGVKWPTLAAKTIMYKQKHYPVYATTPLVRTKTMSEAFKAKATAKSLTISNDTPYFKYHQSSEARHKIPYRPMMGINDDVGNIIKKILTADIKSKIEAA